MLKLFKPDTTDFSHNGVTVLPNTTNVIIREVLNGEYELSFSHPIEQPRQIKGPLLCNHNVICGIHLVGEEVDVDIPSKAYYLKEDYIVLADGQPFRIYDVQRNEKQIDCKARHIFYDLLGNFLEDCRPTNINRLGALKWILKDTQFKHNFTVDGDLGPTNTRYFVRKNPVEAIMGDDGVLSRWGGEIVRDKWNIQVWDSRGRDNGIVIRSGKNIVGIKETINTDDVATRIMPTGLDENNTVIMLPEKYIDSKYIDRYSEPKIQHIHFSDIKVDKETGITKDDVIRMLRLRVRKLYEEEKVDLPKVNYKIDFIELSKTEEYKHYKVIEQLLVGDMVQVYYPKLNINLKTKVIKTEKRFIGNRWINDKVELGNQIGNITTNIGKLDNILTDTGNVNAEAIWGELNASRAYLRAMSDQATPHVERAILFEDRNPDSPTYGAMCLGTRGFQIARELVNDEWHWSTFGTGQGFTADLITAGILTSLDGTLRLDLGGNRLLTYDSNKNPALEMKNMNFYFYDWKNYGEKAGIIYTHELSESKKMGLSMAHYADHNLSLSYYNSDKNSFYPYILFDKYHMTTPNPITVYENVDMTNADIHYRYNNAPSGVIRNRRGDLNIGYMNDGNSVNFGRAWSDEFEHMFSVANHRTTMRNVGFISWENADFNRDVTVIGSLSVSGSKNSLQKTKDYGDRLINAYETLGYYFGDIGKGKTGDDGKCIVEIDDLCTQVMNTDIPYHVTLTAQVDESVDLEHLKNMIPMTLTTTKPTYFVVIGEPNTWFTWELKAKRRGYENVRAERPDNTLNQPESIIGFDKGNNKDEEISNILLEKDNLDDILLNNEVI